MNFRSRTFLVNYLRNKLAFLTPQDLNLSEDVAKIDYIGDTSSGGVIRVIDQVTGTHYYEVVVREKRK